MPTSRGDCAATLGMGGCHPGPAGKEAVSTVLLTGVPGETSAPQNSSAGSLAPWTKVQKTIVHTWACRLAQSQSLTSETPLHNGGDGAGVSVSTCPDRVGLGQGFGF